MTEVPPSGVGPEAGQVPSRGPISLSSSESGISSNGEGSGRVGDGGVGPGELARVKHPTTGAAGAEPRQPFSISLSAAYGAKTALFIAVVVVTIAVAQLYLHRVVDRVADSSAARDLDTVERFLRDSLVNVENCTNAMATQLNAWAAARRLFDSNDLATLWDDVIAPAGLAALQEYRTSRMGNGILWRFNASFLDEYQFWYDVKFENVSGSPWRDLKVSSTDHERDVSGNPIPKGRRTLLARDATFVIQDEDDSGDNGAAGGEVKYLPLTFNASAPFVRGSLRPARRLHIRDEVAYNFSGHEFLFEAEGRPVRSKWEGSKRWLADDGTVYHFDTFIETVNVSGFGVQLSGWLATSDWLEGLSQRFAADSERMVFVIDASSGILLASNSRSINAVHQQECLIPSSIGNRSNYSRAACELPQQSVAPLLRSLWGPFAAHAAEQMVMLAAQDYEGVAQGAAPARVKVTTPDGKMYFTYFRHIFRTSEMLTASTSGGPSYFLLTAQEAATIGGAPKLVRAIIVYTYVIGAIVIAAAVLTLISTYFNFIHRTKHIEKCLRQLATYDFSFITDESEFFMDAFDGDGQLKKRRHFFVAEIRSLYDAIGSISASLERAMPFMPMTLERTEESDEGDLDYELSNDDYDNDGTADMLVEDLEGSPTTSSAHLQSGNLAGATRRKAAESGGGKMIQAVDMREKLGASLPRHLPGSTDAFGDEGEGSGDHAALSGDTSLTIMEDISGGGRRSKARAGASGGGALGNHSGQLHQALSNPFRRSTNDMQDVDLSHHSMSLESLNASVSSIGAASHSRLFEIMLTATAARRFQRLASSSRSDGAGASTATSSGAAAAATADATAAAPAKQSAETGAKTSKLGIDIFPGSAVSGTGTAAADGAAAESSAASTTARPTPRGQARHHAAGGSDAGGGSAAAASSLSGSYTPPSSRSKRGKVKTGMGNFHVMLPSSSGGGGGASLRSSASSSVTSIVSGEGDTATHAAADSGANPLSVHGTPQSGSRAGGDGGGGGRQKPKGAAHASSSARGKASSLGASMSSGSSASSGASSASLSSFTNEMVQANVVIALFKLSPAIHPHNMPNARAGGAVVRIFVSEAIGAIVSHKGWVLDTTPTMVTALWFRCAQPEAKACNAAMDFHGRINKQLANVVFSATPPPVAAATVPDTAMPCHPFLAGVGIVTGVSYVGIIGTAAKKSLAAESHLLERARIIADAAVTVKSPTLVTSEVSERAEFAAYFRLAEVVNVPPAATSALRLRQSTPLREPLFQCLAHQKSPDDEWLYLLQQQEANASSALGAGYNEGITLFMEGRYEESVAKFQTYLHSHHQQSLQQSQERAGAKGGGGGGGASHGDTFVEHKILALSAVIAEVRASLATGGGGGGNPEGNHATSLAEEIMRIHCFAFMDSATGKYSRQATTTGVQRVDMDTPMLLDEASLALSNNSASS